MKLSFDIKDRIKQIVEETLIKLANEKSITWEKTEIQINLTPNDFTGHYTLVIFPFIKKLGIRPDELGNMIGESLKEQEKLIRSYNLVKGFLNIEIDSFFWKNSLNNIINLKNWGSNIPLNRNIMIEYPSPNTNKPLHLGHLRNIFLGFSLSRILEANGYHVIPVCLYNDRGTNISKSMLAYLKSDVKKTPESSGIKGDKLVGDYYVQYSGLYKSEIKDLVSQGLSEEQAKKESKLEKEINELTIKWEQYDPEVRQLWEMMNGWFYSGVKETFKSLDITFAKEYFESDVYDKGRETVKEGLEKGVFLQKEDTSVWIDLTDIGLDQKVVLRSNGTTVYITQDIALAYEKQKEFDFEKSIYVVGNEQDYHFKVLFEILKRLGLKASDNLYHLSYGMVELPTGKMKSREGTVVDADDLIEEVIQIAKDKSNEQGKLAEIDLDARDEIYRQIGLGALRYFILKVDPLKKMIFNPEDSIDFNGNTAPFIQYIYARTQSLLRNAKSQGIVISPDDLEKSQYAPNEKEEKLIRWIIEFPEVVKEAGSKYSPALIANYVYQLASDFSNFYHDYKVLKEENEAARNFRLSLSNVVGNTLKKGLYLLGIEAPERM